MSMISPGLKYQIIQHLFLNAIQNIPEFAKYPDVMDFIVQNIEAH